MSDLVSRLKEAGKWIDAEACFTAADEITRLRVEFIHERFLREQAEALREQLRDENERLRGTLHRISLASQNSMSTKTECGALARKALLNEELSVSNAKAAGSYNLHRIAWELAQTASGNAYHGNALRVAKDLPGLCDTDRALLDPCRNRQPGRNRSRSAVRPCHSYQRSERRGGLHPVPGRDNRSVPVSSNG